METSRPLNVLIKAANAPAQVMPLRMEPQGTPPLRSSGDWSEGETMGRREDERAPVSASPLFPLSDLPELARGQGVMLQRYRDGGLSDAVAFQLADGLSWSLGGESGRTRTETDLTPWRAARGAAGRMPPIGFPRSNRFG